MQSKGQVSARLKNNQIKEPKKSYNTQNGNSEDKSAVAIVKTAPQLCCVSHDSEPSELPKSVKYRVKTKAESFGINSTSTIRTVYATSSKYPGKEKAIAWKNTGQNSHQRSLHARKFEDRSQEETERQERCARGKTWNLARNIYKLKEKDKATFYSPTDEWIVPAASTIEPEKRVCSGLWSIYAYGQQGDLNSAELETMRISKNPTMVMTANGEVQTREEATVYVKELDLFVTVMLLEETPAVLSLGKLCEDHRYTYHWTSGQKTHLTKNGKRINCNVANYVPFVVPALSTSSSTQSSPASSTFSSQDSVVGAANPQQKEVRL